MWIEAVAPGRGSEQNPDHIPDLRPTKPGNTAQYSPHTQIQLRVSGAIYDKQKQYEKFIQKRIIDHNDAYIIAVSMGRFSLQASPIGIPDPVKTVYPIGPIQSKWDIATGAIIKTEYSSLFEIQRSGKKSINRTAFSDNEYSSISGLIWSRMSIGNFWYDDIHDISFVHNFFARRRLQERWTKWHEEYVAEDCGDTVKVYPIDT